MQTSYVEDPLDTEFKCALEFPTWALSAPLSVGFKKILFFFSTQVPQVCTKSVLTLSPTTRVQVQMTSSLTSFFERNGAIRAVMNSFTGSGTGFGTFGYGMLETAPVRRHHSRLTPPQASILACPKTGGGPPLPLCRGPRPPSSSEVGSGMVIELGSEVEAVHSWPCK